MITPDGLAVIGEIPGYRGVSELADIYPSIHGEKGEITLTVTIQYIAVMSAIFYLTISFLIINLPETSVGKRQINPVTRAGKWSAKPRNFVRQIDTFIKMAC